MSKKKKRKLNTTGSSGLIIKCVTIIGVLLLLAGGTFWFLKSFQVTAVEVEGNTHYGTEQIKEMVMDSKFSNNSVFLSVRVYFAPPAS